MIIVLHVTVGENYWGDDVVQKQIEVHTENPVPRELPWALICAGLIDSALQEYEQKAQENATLSHEEEKRDE